MQFLLEASEIEGMLINSFRPLRSVKVLVLGAASDVKKGKPLEILKEASAPFLERVDLAAEKVRAFQCYTEEAPKKIEAVPKMFISDKDLEQIKQAPEAAILIGKAVDGLLKLRDRLKEQLKT